MTGGVCAVCGGALAPPCTDCPRCATPHHSDCWEYNRGCSIYGCTGGRVIAVSGAVSLPDLRVAAPAPAVDPARTALGALVVAGIGTAVGVAPALFTAGALGAWALISRPRDELEPVRGRVDLGRERKAVAAALGAQSGEQLAQAYGLFEQRHPTQALEREEQQVVALELLRAGHTAMGMAALEKALAQRGLDDKTLLAERRRLLIRDPAFAVDGLAGPLGPSVGKTGLEDDVSTLRRALDVDPPEGVFWLLALTPRGWPMEFQMRPALPSYVAEGARARASLIAGPFDRDRAVAEARARWRADQPAMLVPESALALPDRVETVHQVHLSQKAAVFVTPTSERAFLWEDVRAAIYARIDHVKKLRPHVRDDRFDLGSRATDVAQMLDGRVVSQPIVEVHVGASHERFRIDTPRPGLFDYLGRRKESSHAANMSLVAKDLARFGGPLRVSHGLMYQLVGRSGPAYHFPDRAHLEEYVLWFHALGTPAVRDAWRPVCDELLGEVR